MSVMQIINIIVKLILNNKMRQPGNSNWTDDELYAFMKVYIFLFIIFHI
jgi:hypothetical protein